MGNMECLICKKEIITINGCVSYGKYIMHFDCWDDLEPSVIYNMTDCKEIRLQRKNERLLRIRNKVSELINESEKKQL